jgi:hypothetical protein
MVNYRFSLLLSFQLNVILFIVLYNDVCRCMSSTPLGVKLWTNKVIVSIYIMEWVSEGWGREGGSEWGGEWVSEWVSEGGREGGRETHQLRNFQLYQYENKLIFFRFVNHCLSFFILFVLFCLPFFVCLFLFCFTFSNSIVCPSIYGF